MKVARAPGIYPRRIEFIWVFLTYSYVRVLEMKELAGWSFSPGTDAIAATLSSLRPRNKKSDLF